MAATVPQIERQQERAAKQADIFLSQGNERAFRRAYNKFSEFEDTTLVSASRVQFLYQAVKAGKPELAEWCMDNGLHQWKGFTISNALVEEQYDVARYFLNKFSVQDVTPFKNDLLTLASKKGQLDIVKTLVNDHAADIYYKSAEAFELSEKFQQQNVKNYFQALFLTDRINPGTIPADVIERAENISLDATIHIEVNGTLQDVPLVIALMSLPKVRTVLQKLDHNIKPESEIMPCFTFEDLLRRKNAMHDYQELVVNNRVKKIIHQPVQSVRFKRRPR